MCECAATNTYFEWRRKWSKCFPVGFLELRRRGTNRHALARRRRLSSSKCIRFNSPTMYNPRRFRDRLKYFENSRDEIEHNVCQKTSFLVPLPFRKTKIFQELLTTKMSSRIIDQCKAPKERKSHWQFYALLIKTKNFRFLNFRNIWHGPFDAGWMNYFPVSEEKKATFHHSERKVETTNYGGWDIHDDKLRTCRTACEQLSVKNRPFE